MAHPPDLEACMAAVEEVAEDAAAAHDRDLADLGVKVDAHRKAINALGEQTAGRFDRLEQKVGGLEREMRSGFTETRGKLDQTAAGQQRIVDLLDRLLSEGERQSFAAGPVRPNPPGIPQVWT